MRAGAFVGIALLSGLVSGLILGGINLVAVEPFVDQAIDLEVINAMKAGEDVGTPEEIAQYRTWQKGGQIAAGGILGLSLGSLFALVYAFTWPLLKGSIGIKKGLFLAAIMWFTIFLIPFLKYPGNPPAVGDPETIYYRQTIFILFTAASGLGALGFAFLYKKILKGPRKFVAPAMYAAYVLLLVMTFPQNPDEVTAPMELVNNFRVVSALTVTIFWFTLGALFGVCWDKFKPHVKVASKL